MDQGYDAYERGDIDMAILIWQELALDGNATAQLNLGQLYRLGQGVEQDDEEAVKWYIMAARNGSEIASVTLVQMEQDGRASKADVAAAFPGSEGTLVDSLSTLADTPPAATPATPKPRPRQPDPAEASPPAATVAAAPVQPSREPVPEPVPVPVINLDLEPKPEPKPEPGTEPELESIVIAKTTAASAPTSAAPPDSGSDVSRTATGPRSRNGCPSRGHSTPATMAANKPAPNAVPAPTVAVATGPATQTIAAEPAPEPAPITAPAPAVIVASAPARAPTPAPPPAPAPKTAAPAKPAAQAVAAAPPATTVAAAKPTWPRAGRPPATNTPGPHQAAAARCLCHPVTGLRRQGRTGELCPAKAWRRAR